MHACMSKFRMKQHVQAQSEWSLVTHLVKTLNLKQSKTVATEVPTKLVLSDFEC